MAEFVYTALDASGATQAGQLAAESRNAALRQIVAKGLQPVSVQADASLATVHRIHSARLSQRVVEAFTRELANLLAAGISLSRALHIISRETASQAARRQWTAIHDDVVGGMPLADALARRPRTFSSIYVAMVRAGETGGFLEMVLEQIADLRSREQDLKGRVKAALVYPVVLAVIAMAVLVFLLTYFIPRFSGIFAEFGAALPPLTRAIVASSRFVSQYGFAVLVGVALAVVVYRRSAASESGRRFLERVWLRTPGLGTVLARFALVRFCRMLGALIGAGVPLIAALRVAREAVGNQTLSDAVSEGVDQVERGAPLAEGLATAEALFPPSVVEMVAVAEESSRLDKELARLATTYEKDLDRRLRMLVALAEPAMLFVMAAVIGVVVIGMLLPVFTLQELIR